MRITGDSSRALPREAEVVVVGAGISGCATAYNLAKRGVKVVLLEKDDIAFEASGRTLAMVGLLGKHHLDEFRLSAASLALWRGLEKELGADIELIDAGRIFIADSDKDLPLFQEIAQGAKEAEVTFEILEPREARSRFPFLEGPFLQAIFSPDGAHVNPEKAVHAYARAAREHGATIHTGCLAQYIGVSAGRVSSVHTTQGDIKTDTVVNAAGVWAYRLADRVGVHFPIQLIRLPQAETEPMPRLFDSMVRGPTYAARQTASGSVRISGGYRDLAVMHDLSLHDLRDITMWLPRLLRVRKNINFSPNLALLKHDLQTLLGALLPGMRRDVAPVGLEPKQELKNLRRKQANLAKVVPQLKGARIQKHWAGYVDMTLDFLPILGEVDRPKGFYLTTGHSGHGFTVGPIVGKLMSELIVDGRASLPLHTFRASRFSQEKVPVPRRLM